MRIGIYQSYWGAVGGGQRYIGVVAEALAENHNVTIVHHCEDFDRASVEEALEVDLSKVAFRFVPRPQRPAWPSSNPLVRLQHERDWCRELSEPYDLYIDSSDSPPYFCHARRGVLLTHFPLIGYEEFHHHTDESWRRRSVADRLARRAFHRYEWSRRMATYDLCVVNSRFTREWFRRRWKRDAAVVYPPLRDGLRPGKKERLILTIGAFRSAQHKKHSVLLDAFRRLCEGGVKGWRYVMVGACGSDPEDRAYVDRLRCSAAGCPVEIWTDASGEDLREALGQASILWHSMGYGVDPAREPGRMEHFGMVATEAMAAGCVPIVFRGGGLVEIVGHGENGFLWSTLDELKEATRQLSGDASRLQRMQQAAIRRAGDFAREPFRRRLGEVLGPLLE